MKKLIKKILPKNLLNYYYRFLAKFSSFIYGNPSQKMIVIGVTGTNGKSSTVAMIAKVLESAGDKVGSTSTVDFKVADQEWLNDKKMTMLGRFQLQKLLAQMVKAGCKYAVIETSSEGIKQYRHLGINYDYVVFTNLTPEHIESHGSFENYQKAKGKLFQHLTQKNRKYINNKIIEKVSVINYDDKYSDYFAGFPADKVLFFSEQENVNGLIARNVVADLTGTSFEIDGQPINLKMLGSFNVYNALPAIIIGDEEGLSFVNIKKALESIEVIPGRMEVIQEGQDFGVIVDYAPEPASMQKLYETINLFKREELKVNNIIHVLGSCGGGRDRDRRPILGRMAGENADYVFVTNEDPYDDDPMQIINEVAAGAIEAGKIENENLFKILDRKEAIEKALSLAKTDDLVLVTGKGSEQAMAIKGGKYISWDDRKIIRKYLKTITSKII